MAGFDFVAARVICHCRIFYFCLQGLSYASTNAMAWVYGSLLALMGVLISWAAPACNNPIFAEIVPPHLRNMIYSFDRQALFVPLT